MIVCFYIDIGKYNEGLNYLELLLHEHDYPFYNATANEKILETQHTLEDIECQYEGK